MSQNEVDKKQHNFSYVNNSMRAELTPESLAMVKIEVKKAIDELLDDKEFLAELKKKIVLLNT